MKEYIEHPRLKELKKNNANWEAWFDCKISQRHFCSDEAALEDLAIRDSAIICASSENSEPTWSFAHVWLADKEEIADGEAEEIGEVMSSYCFSIKFCPFCGEKLDK